MRYREYTTAAAGRDGICVKCPYCGRAALVTSDGEQARFCCTSCGHSRKRVLMEYSNSIENHCKSCGRYYRVQVPGSHFSVLTAVCPYCGFRMPGRVQKRLISCRVSREVQRGREPYFGLELWFLSDCGGKLVWALNRTHLSCLIDYLSAGLRAGPSEDPAPGLSQSDRLPKFMKTAKNRKRIIKCLKRMQKL